jgi:hypothetical protein
MKIVVPEQQPTFFPILEAACGRALKVAANQGGTDTTEMARLSSQSDHFLPSQGFTGNPLGSRSKDMALQL